ncbi:MAG: hypothetical protein VW576_09435, partial [Opitutae bacterium]
HKVDRVVNAPKENGEDESNSSPETKQSPKQGSKPDKEPPLAQPVKESNNPAVEKDDKVLPDKSDSKDLKNQATFEF